MKKMKKLEQTSWDGIVFSDIHLDKSINGSFSVTDIENLLTEIESIADRTSVSAMLFCGDMFDRPGFVRSQAYNLVHGFLARWKASGRQFVGIAGNHDIVSRHEEQSACKSLFGMFDNGYIDMQPVNYNLKFGKHDVTVFCVPYTSNKDALFHSIEFAADASGKIKILMLHEYLTGLVPPQIQSVEFPKAARSAFNLVLSGHYHGHNRKSHIMHVGAPRQLDWGDAGTERGILLFRVHGNGFIDTAFEPLQSPPLFVRVGFGSEIGQNGRGMFVSVEHSGMLSSQQLDEERKRLMEFGARAVSFDLVTNSSQAAIQRDLLSSVGDLWNDALEQAQLTIDSVEYRRDFMSYMKRVETKARMV